MTTVRALFITLFLLLTLHGSLAQSVVRGRVTDSQSGEALAGVYVIWGKSTGMTTDTNGFYSFTAAPDLLTVEFRFIGYRTRSETLRPGTRDTVVVNIELEPGSLFLDQVVVSADRMEQKRSDLTVTMNVIRSDQIFKTHITDAQELITKTPGIEVLDGQVSIRGGSGFSYGVGSRVLALIDGLPMMSPDAGNVKWNFLPFENLSQVEIIKGASSVLYGSSALNGVINFRTADASNIPMTSFFTEIGVYGNPPNMEWKWWDTPRLSGHASFSHLQKFGNTDLGLGFNVSSDRGYRKYNDESLGRVNIRFKHHSSRTEGLKYGININGGKTYKTDFVLWEDGLTGGLKQDTSTVSRLHGYYFSADPFVTLGKRDKVRHDLRMRLQMAENKFPVRNSNNAGSVSLYGEYQFWYSISDHLNITTGFSETWSIIKSEFFGDHRGLNLAGFAQAEWHPLTRLKVTGGIRIEQNFLDSEPDKLVPVFRTGLNYQAADYTFLRASFGQGYRYPSIAEKHASTTLGSVRIFPNLLVQPESGWSSEAGIAQGFMIGRFRGEGDLSVFLSQNRDMIEYVFGPHDDPVSGLAGIGFKASNVEYSRIYGTESEFLLSNQFGKMTVTFTGSYTYIQPVEISAYTGRSKGLYLKYRRKHSARLGLSAVTDRVETGIDMYARSAILDIDDVFLKPDTRDLILPGFYDYWVKNNRPYFLMDGNLSYRIVRSLKLSLAVRNITNTEYMGRPGDIQPHRNFSLRLSSKF